MEGGYIYIGNNIFSTLLAISSDEQSKGLMFQAWPPPVMSFIYKSAQVNKFWMKSTPSKLDIVFCNNGKVSEICYGEPYSTKMIGGDSPSDLVIEFPYGTISFSNIKVGDLVGLVKPTEGQLKKLIQKNTRVL